jgi:hypothetical protein
MESSVDSFEYKSHHQIYNFILLPANYMQVVLVNTNLRSCFSAMYIIEYSATITINLMARSKSTLPTVGK